MYDKNWKFSRLKKKTPGTHKIHDTYILKLSLNLLQPLIDALIYLCVTQSG